MKPDVVYRPTTKYDDRPWKFRDSGYEEEFKRPEDFYCEHVWEAWDMEYGGATCQKCDGWSFILGAR